MNAIRKKKLWHFRLIILVINFIYMLLIAGLSLVPTSMIVKSGFYFSGMDKWLHAIMYFTLAILLFLAWRQARFFSIRMITFLAFTLAFVYSFILELLQAMIASLERSFEWLDLLANAAGAFVGIFIMLVLFSYLKRQKRMCINE